MPFSVVMAIICAGLAIYVSNYKKHLDERKFPVSLMLFIVAAIFLALSGVDGSHWDGNRSGSPSRFP